MDGIPHAGKACRASARTLIVHTRPSISPGRISRGYMDNVPYLELLPLNAELENDQQSEAQVKRWIHVLWMQAAATVVSRRCGASGSDQAK